MAYAATQSAQQLSNELGSRLGGRTSRMTRWSSPHTRRATSDSVPVRHPVTASPTPRPSASRSPPGTPENNSTSGCNSAAAGNAALTRRLEQVLARTRERGFDVDWTTPALAQAAQVVGTLQRDGMPAHLRKIMDQLIVEYTTIGFLSDDDPAREAQPIATIAAPVFAHRQRVALIVCVHPLRALTSRQVSSIGRRLTRAATTVSTRSASRVV